MHDPNRLHGISTLVNHFTECENPLHAHIAPIYQTSTFIYPDAATGAAIKRGEQDGYIYTRLSNPNCTQLARKYTLLEGLDLLQGQPPEQTLDQTLAGMVFPSGMAAITASVLARVGAGQTVIAQHALYSNTYSFFAEIAPHLGIKVVWVRDTTPDGWQRAVDANPQAQLIFAESPVNPTMLVVDLEVLAGLAHDQGCWLFVDNTFATPYCQRPLTLGADAVIHSTTKYLSGHGVIIGGAVISRHLDFMHEQVQKTACLLGGSPSPFETWLANLGLRTFELRMQRHCENAMMLAQYLQRHPKVKAVHYPGLKSHPGYEIARKQMGCFGGMLSFELEGGYQAATGLMDRLRVATLTVSLGTVDTLIQHPASMTHADVPRDERLAMGIPDGLMRLSVGIENVEDLLADFEDSLEYV